MLHNVTRVGTKRDARKALLGRLDYLGDGADRTVYVSPDRKTVYKVDKPRVGRYDGNFAEVTVHAALARVTSESGQPDDFRHIAHTTAWVIDGQTVVAQPAVTPYRDVYGKFDDATVTRAYEDVRRVRIEYHLMDIHDGNWGIAEDGTGVIFDFSRCRAGEVEQASTWYESDEDDESEESEVPTPDSTSFRPCTCGECSFCQPDQQTMGLVSPPVAPRNPWAWA